MTRRAITNPLALAVLGLLQERPMHPYEVASELRRRYKDASFKLTTGSLYDTVDALQRRGWIEPTGTSRSGNRPARTVYAQTAAGHDQFVQWLDELVRVPQPEYPRFLAAVAYLGALGPERAADALSERAQHLGRRIDETQALLDDTVGAGSVPRLFMIEVECALHAWRSELAWTEQTAAEIRDGRLGWPDPAPARDEGWAPTGPDAKTGTSEGERR